MAENFSFTPGVGGTGGADDIAGVKYPFVKLVDGTADSTTAIYADEGGVANALRVVPANDIADATYIGDIKFGEAEPNSAAILTALEKIDDWDDSDYCNVNLNIAGTDVSANAGVLTAQTLRVTIATDDEVNNFLGAIDADTSNMATSLGNLDNAVDGNFLNVNVNAAGTDLTMNAGVLTAQTQRVTIATDDEVNNLLGTIDADTGAIKTAVELIDDAIYADDADWIGNTSKHMLVGGLYQVLPQTITDGDVGPIQVDQNGRIIVHDSLAIKTAVEKIDDWDATHAAAAAADGCQVMGAAYSVALPTDVGADGDAARICTDRHGRIVRGLMPQWFNAIFDSANASAEGNTVKAKTASRKIYILSLTISVDAEMWVKLQKEDSTAITPKFWLKAGGGLTKTYPPEAPLVVDTVNVDLEVITEGAGNIGVEVTGYLAV